MKVALILFLFYSSVLFSFESSDSFQIKVYDGSVKVIAPDKYDKNLHAVIENQTLSKLVGKLVTDKDRLIATIAINSQASKSIELKSTPDERIFFVPLAPPFQEVELIIGHREYEIPPKR